ncbi:BlaI/MecI/CopY family transcriptional regulator [Aquimarina sp. MMG016]|uniref:BlaI/MecI/CopY family transcriptional regulator n=1 Tax=Aquimarina sp. MMG016 TaxID=2822690 RepID=UPI001B39FF71|nr:BlaI/MecI/CopY family transcriptional regulator [Aquimarina sp. MMG016]MBQ4821657.1 BlaI/MecI/CopY family transcriptional regulator [Aquimarina sp. MMG016]
MKSFTDKEFEILTVLWELQEGSVQEVHEKLNTTSRYTTTLKKIQIMYDKGLLDRRKEGKKHIYIPKVDQKKAQVSGIKKMISGLFGGSTVSFAQSFLGNTKPTKEELEAIKEMIKKMEKDA